MPDPSVPDPSVAPVALARDRGRSSFGPVVLLGLGTGALAAVASAKPWIGGASKTGNSDATMATLDAGSRFPLASAVSLVLLAAWGVLLVTRGRVRRVFAWLTVVAAVALVVCVVVAHSTLPDTARDSLDDLLGRGSASTTLNGWFWTTAVCAVLALVPAVLATRLVGRWPEMGSRYDAPGASAAPTEKASLDPDRDLWHALDEGRDPTDPHRA
jgi:uncharacterized membrane protein (TIGR02234 family)